MACVAVNSLVRTLEFEFLQPRTRPIFQEYQIIPSNRDLIQSLHQKLQILIELFDESRMDRDEAIKHLETQLRDVAFTAEDEIELLIVQLYEEEKEKEEFGIAALFGEKPYMVFMDAEEELQCILQKAIEDIDGLKEAYKQARVALQGRKTTPDAFPKSDDDGVIMKGDSDSQSEDKMVGKNEEFNTVRKMLIQHPSKQLQVVSVEGMGGIGKTTLARRVYHDSSVASYFDKRAWVVASQNHDEKKMLTDLLKSMGIEGDNLALRQGLKGQRYLIVIDDVWSTGAWDAVLSCFPDDGNGSRVLLTTRLAEITKYTCSTNDFSHQMELLDSSESWNLFWVKAYKSKEAEFERIARPIVEKCKGLPLAVVVVAGLFSKLNTLDEWRNVANTLKSSATTTTTIDEECSRILSLSYNHLPHNLRACFLQLAVFSEDAEIYASVVARLWAAEGLAKTCEDEAEKHIRELMYRNLIIARKRSSCGRKIKTFVMHDQLHAFCVSEAQKENLLLVVDENNGFDFSQKCFRWVKIRLEDFVISTLCSSLKRCRSIFCHSSLSPQSSLNLKGFKLLRVFNSDEYIHLKIEVVVHMRYLSNMNLRSIANSWNLENAWNLQTAHIRDYNSWKHLECPQLHYISFNGTSVSTPTRLPTFVNKNLQSITWFNPIVCTEEFFTNFPCLKKVMIWGGKKYCIDCIENLAYLQQLESLSIFIEESYLHTDPINKNIVLLKNLKKLEFVDSEFEWKEMSVLCKLTRLEVLKLSIDACVGEEWELPEDEKFCQLIFLEIEECDLKHWKASGDHFPKLERLVLKSCKKLEEIPIEFAEIPTLKSIKLRRCLPSAVVSAKQIEEEKRGYGDNDMVVNELNTLSSMSLIH